MKLMPQLAFGGTCRDAFEHYAKVLGGTITVMNTFGDSSAELPPGSTAAAPDHVRFAQIEIGDYAINGNDVPAAELRSMQGFNVALHTKDVAEAERIFSGLAEGGHITTPLTEVAWAARFGMLTDRFGVPWLVLALK